MASFIVYDLETGGIDPRMDRIMQFSAARVDADLNLIGEPITLYCKMPYFYQPNKEALEVTGINVEECNEKGLPEYKFAKRIHDFFTEKTDTVVMGFNNVKFDDEFIRNLFYRNFLSPYGYTFKMGNSRWDLINLVRATYALRPQGINWAYKEDGKPSFRLEELTKANGISHENAHDATSDVLATIDIMRLIKQKQSRLFDYAFTIRGAKSVTQFFNKSILQSDDPIVYVGSNGIRLLKQIAFHNIKGRVFLDLTAKNND